MGKLSASTMVSARRIPHARMLAFVPIVAILVAVTMGVVIESGLEAEADPDPSHDPNVLLTFAINYVMGVACLMCVAMRRPFSSVQTHWIFCITFLVIAPLARYLLGYRCWGYPLAHDDYLVTNGFVMLWGTIVAGIGFCSKGGKNHHKGFHQRFHESMAAVFSVSAWLLLFSWRCFLSASRRRSHEMWPFGTSALCRGACARSSMEGWVVLRRR